MTLHIIKLSVGSESLETFVSWHKKKLADQKKTGRKPELVHVTRMTPRRRDEVLDGGSLYWVIKGQIAVRTPLLDLRPLKRNGVSYCGLVYAPKFIALQRRPMRAFQGWRYFDPKDAPPDARGTKGLEKLPEKLQVELVNLGLL
jgi:hypothetical protein